MLDAIDLEAGWSARKQPLHRRRDAEQAMVMMEAIPQEPDGRYRSVRLWPRRV